MRVRRRRSLATPARSCVTVSASRTTVRFKGTIDLVTEADRAAGGSHCRSTPRRACPEHDLLCEEGSVGAPSGATYRWMVDPLDGTTNFAHGLPTFAVSIALEDAGVPVIGVVYDPMRDELFVARKGGGATLNGMPIVVSAVDQLIASILVTGFSYDFARREQQAEVSVIPYSACRPYGRRARPPSIFAISPPVASTATGNGASHHGMSPLGRSL